MGQGRTVAPCLRGPTVRAGSSSPPKPWPPLPPLPPLAALSWLWAPGLPDAFVPGLAPPYDEATAPPGLTWQLMGDEGGLDGLAPPKDEAPAPPGLTWQ